MLAKNNPTGSIGEAQSAIMDLLTAQQKPMEQPKEQLESDNQPSKEA